MYAKNGSAVMHCHNCGVTLGFSKFLKEVDPFLHTEFLLEQKLSTTTETKNLTVEQSPQMEKLLKLPSGEEGLKGLKKISQLKFDHPCKLYIESRQIPPEQHYRLYYAPKYFEWANSLIPEKFDLKKGDEPRLVIPLFNRKKELIGFQGRSFDPDAKLRYITCMIREDQPRVFGLELLDLGRTVYVTEGPIDALFIRNSLATAGGDLSPALSVVSKDKIVLVADNEPRNKDTVKKLSKAARLGIRVCVWPQYIEQKDVNDMIKTGYSRSDIRTIIKQNTFSGLQAELAIAAWKKL
jgi:hypothetical protein